MVGAEIFEQREAAFLVGQPDTHALTVPEHKGSGHPFFALSKLASVGAEKDVQEIHPRCSTAFLPEDNVTWFRSRGRPHRITRTRPGPGNGTP